VKEIELLIAKLELDKEILAEPDAEEAPEFNPAPGGVQTQVGLA
jgi:hypothetical protein